NASAIATETTRNTLEKMPGYHKTIGEEGSNLCKRDFTYTLQEIAKQLIYGREQVGENLLQWWNESIGQYLANRPKDLFTISLESLQDALLSGLSNEPYDLTLEIVQQLFRDAMGTPFSPRRFFFQAPSPHQSPEYSGVKNEKTLRSFFRNLRDRIPEDDLTKIKEFIEGEAEIQEIIIAADNPRSLILAFGESLTCDESHLTQGLLSSLLAYSRYQFAAALLSCLADEDSRAGQELFNWVKQWGAYTDMEWFTWEGLRFLAEVLLPLYESNELENLLRRALKRAEEEKETVFWSRPFFQFLLAGLESLKPYETLIRLTLTSEKPVFSQDPTEEKALRGLFALSLLGSHLKLVRPKFADQILTQKFAALPLTKEVWSKSSEIFHTHLDRLFHELDGKGFYEAMETIKSLPSQKPEKLRFSFKGTPTKEVRNYLSEVKPKGVPHAIRSLLGCNTSDPSQLLWYAALYLSSAVSHETLPAEEMYPLLQWIQNELPQGEWDDFKKKTLTGGYTLPKLIENIESDPQHAAESAFAR
ncbi:MAG: hypothetical protein JJT75_07050, partial [Opitutales bacterium]|nr:hypothetical protein [Opitutales bacterium]